MPCGAAPLGVAATTKLLERVDKPDFLIQNGNAIDFDRVVEWNYKNLNDTYLHFSVWNDRSRWVHHCSDMQRE